MRTLEWLGTEWIHFLGWFAVGLFGLPIAISMVTSWINLDRFYDALVPGNINLGVLLLVMTPYLLYVGYRMSHPHEDGNEELFEE